MADCKKYLEGMREAIKANKCNIQSHYPNTKDGMKRFAKSFGYGLRDSVNKEPMLEIVCVAQQSYLDLACVLHQTPIYPPNTWFRLVCEEFLNE